MNYEYSNSITKTSEFSDIKTKSTELNEENQKIINSTDKSTNKSIEQILEKELNYIISHAHIVIKIFTSKKIKRIY